MQVQDGDRLREDTGHSPSPQATLLTGCHGRGHMLPEGEDVTWLSGWGTGPHLCPARDLGLESLFTPSVQPSSASSPCQVPNPPPCHHHLTTSCLFPTLGKARLASNSPPSSSRRLPRTGITGVPPSEASRPGQLCPGLRSL